MLHHTKDIATHATENEPLKKTNDEYTSEFTDFITRFLKAHPETIQDQHTGWYLYWDKKVDLGALEQAGKDSIPDDHYGFDYAAWCKEGRRHH